MGDYWLNLVNKLVSVFCGVVVSAVLARHLGVVLRGELAFLVQVAGLGSIVLGLGLGHTFIRRYRTDRSPGTYHAVASLLAVQVACMSVAALLLGIYVRDSDVSFVLLLAISTMAYQQFESIMAAYRVRLKMAINLVYSVGRAVAHVAMWWYADAGLGVPVLISAGSCLASAVAYAVATGVIGKFHLPPARYVREVYSFGWVPMLTSLLVILNYNVDLILLKALGQPRDLGIYAVAAGIVTYLWVLPDAIKEVLVSRVVRTDDSRAVLVPLKVAVGASALSIIGCVVVGQPAIPWLFGAEFADAYGLAVVLSLGVIPMVYYKLLGIVVLAEGRRWFYFTALAASVVFNAVVNLWAVPRHGAIGASWVSVVSYGLTGLLFAGYFARLSGLRLADVLWVTRSDLVQMRTSMRRRP